MPEKTRSLVSGGAPICSPAVAVIEGAVYRARNDRARGVTIVAVRMSDVLREMRQQKSSHDARPRLMERYAAFLPVTGNTPNVSLGEGYTPLVHARRLGRTIGVPLLHLKVEGMNPTGSFKDRGMVVAVAKALESGAQAIICASTGNTAASAAAYGAAVGLEVIVVLPAGQIAHG